MRLTEQINTAIIWKCSAQMVFCAQNTEEGWNKEGEQDPSLQRNCADGEPPHATHVSSSRERRDA
jgi:hypothetical protein